MSKRTEYALLFLRVALGMLLVWWGLAKIYNPGMGVGISKKFYFDLVSVKDLQYYFAWFEFTVGSLVVLGAFRKYVFPVQMVITGVSSLAIWNALLDPFAFYLPVAKVAPIQHLFYPSLIIIASGIVYYSIREHDKYCVDTLLKKFSSKRAKDPEPEGELAAV